MNEPHRLNGHRAQSKSGSANSGAAADDRRSRSDSREDLYRVRALPHARKDEVEGVRARRIENQIDDRREIARARHIGQPDRARADILRQGLNPAVEDDAPFGITLRIGASKNRRVAQVERRGDDVGATEAQQSDHSPHVKTAPIACAVDVLPSCVLVRVRV